MDRVTLDDSILSQFPGKPFEICDQSGRVVGVFQPAMTLQLELDEAEFERRMQEDEEFTTEEVLQYLERL